MDFKLSILKCVLLSGMWIFASWGIHQISKFLDIRVVGINNVGDILIYLGILAYLIKHETLRLISAGKAIKYLTLKLLLVSALIAFILFILSEVPNYLTSAVYNGNLNINSKDNEVDYSFEALIWLLTHYSNLFISLIIGIFINPFVEEIVFRRYIFVGLRNKYNVKYAFLITNLLFALLHLPNLPNAFFSFLFGLVCTYLFYFTFNLWFPIMTHMVYNLLTCVQPIFVPDNLIFTIYQKSGIFYWCLIAFSAIILFLLLYFFKVVNGRSIVGQEAIISK